MRLPIEENHGGACGFMKRSRSAPSLCHHRTEKRSASSCSASKQDACPAQNPDSISGLVHSIVNMEKVAELWRIVEGDIVCLHMLYHHPEDHMSTVHIHAVCHIVLVTVAFLVTIYFLQAVLLPVLLAAGMSVLLEPIMYVFVDGWVRTFTPQRYRPSFKGVLKHGDTEGDALGSPKTTVEVVCSFPSMQTDGGATPDGEEADLGGQLGRSPSSAMTLHSERSLTTEAVADGNCGSQVAAIARQCWCVGVSASLIICMFLTFSLIGVWVISSMNSVDWQKYLRSERLQQIRAVLAKNGVEDVEEAMREAHILSMPCRGPAWRS
eukprot:TRINITY_DN21214_c0_g1_i1.p1 TRINITY_DN21214_c0_g1~~TRINITY_DN21214_c0_g1_i1.p1  ORF type:complete len:323 (-),score=37.08 TRINITY_DN21214_c0_g1_i1:171-1139(-)